MYRNIRLYILYVQYELAFSCMAPVIWLLAAVSGPQYDYIPTSISADIILNLIFNCHIYTSYDNIQTLLFRDNSLTLEESGVVCIFGNLDLYRSFLHKNILQLLTSTSPHNIFTHALTCDVLSTAKSSAPGFDSLHTMASGCCQRASVFLYHSISVDVFLNLSFYCHAYRSCDHIKTVLFRDNSNFFKLSSSKTPLGLSHGIRRQCFNFIMPNYWLATIDIHW